jgi:hypothetical protein
MVGDNLEWEVAVPKRLGLTCVWVDRHGRGLRQTSIPLRIVSSTVCPSCASAFPRMTIVIRPLRRAWMWLLLLSLPGMLGGPCGARVLRGAARRGDGHVAERAAGAHRERHRDAAAPRFLVPRDPRHLLDRRSRFRARLPTSTPRSSWRTGRTFVTSAAWSRASGVSRGVASRFRPCHRRAAGERSVLPRTIARPIGDGPLPRGARRRGSAPEDGAPAGRDVLRPRGGPGWAGAQREAVEAYDEAIRSGRSSSTRSTREPTREKRSGTRSSRGRTASRQLRRRRTTPALSVWIPFATEPPPLPRLTGSDVVLPLRHA